MGLSNYEWFVRSDLRRYAGQWVAVDRERVLASDRSFAVLMRRVEREFPRARPFVAKVHDKLLRLRCGR